MAPESGVSVGFRHKSRGEYATDAAVHGLGIGLGLAGAVALLVVAVPPGDLRAIAAVLIYSAGLLAMWICSGFYNLWPWSTRRELLRYSDQAAIFAMIAGTYTPFTLFYLDGLTAAAMTSLVWIVAGVGIAVRLLFPKSFDRISVGLYLAMGWVGLVTIGPLLGSMAPTTFALLTIGGLLYSAGVVFHLWERLPFQTAIWHAFVLVAAGCHYAAVLGTVLGLSERL
jgi:hemolysin III